MLTQQRHRFEPCKRWLGARLGSLGLPPNFYTLLGLALAWLACWLFWAYGPFQAALCGTLASLTDFVDGAVARYQNRESRWGNYLEALVDRAIEVSLLLTMSAALGPVISFALAGSLLISYCKPRVALVVPADNHDWPGIGDHSDRMVLILLAMALAGAAPGIARGLLWLLSAMTLVGCLQRVAYAQRLIAEYEEGQPWQSSEE